MKINWATVLEIIIALVVVLALKHFVLDKAFPALEASFEENK